MTERRKHRRCWRPSPGFEWLVFPLFAVFIGLMTTCAHAETTEGERSAYRVGIVVGAYYSFIGGLVERLTAAGVPAANIPTVIGNGCGDVTSVQVAEVVLLREPRPRTEVDAVIQTHAVMRRACASLEESGA